MNQRLYLPLTHEAIWNNRVYRLRTSFDCVLALFDYFEDSSLFDDDKLRLCLSTIIAEKKIPQSTELLSSACNVLIPCPQEHKPSQARAFDFKQDSQLIYAGFMQAYGIDLFEQIGKLHWWKFLALFQGLPGDTRIRQVMDIRTKPLPKPNKHNREEIIALQKAKNAVALQVSQEERERSLAEGLKRMAAAMVAEASKDGK